LPNTETERIGYLAVKSRLRNISVDQTQCNISKYLKRTENDTPRPYYSLSQWWRQG